ncbi:Non-specific serine/threonine protein kinase protein [Dioscorea alata]|uniref:Non-specific serine/threonine protein kinase protein n=1 Tax=Dioscorea alata TaxID=55571 RepID=A0ACB7UP89_DIOAL|nr:Non-specific serine/threonine protein kinase protein [Dioscorea alata]
MDFSLFHIFLLILFSSTIPTTLSDDPLYYVCSNDSNYTKNSHYNTNLNLVFSTLYSEISSTGFSNTTKGQPPYQAYGMATCRGDITSTTCPECVNTSIHAITQLCPRQKNAAIWYNDCLLRYSDQNFFSIVDTSVKLYIQTDAQTPDPKRFRVLLGQLMNGLATYAAFNSTRMFGFKAIDFTSSVKLYGLTQCTRDLSQKDCYACLERIIKNMTGVGKQALGGLSRSCVAGYQFSENLSPDTHVAATPPSSSIPPVSSVLPNVTSIARINRKNKIKACIIVIPLVAGAGLVFLVCMCLWRWRTRRLKNTFSADDGNEAEVWYTAVQIDLATLKRATDNFSDENELGKGGFGSVYKGVLEGGQEIAVKRLSRTSRQGLQELRNEVILVGKLHHKNLVRLLGYCMEEQEKLLVYEFLSNNSLDKYLADPTRRGKLNWRTRHKIIQGTGRGLLYLHQESRIKIIHRDLKASNILLDKEMNPKISDFGLAKLFDMDETQANTRRISGTYGYMAPEYALHGQFSTKSDVFSYGVLVLEIVTGRLNSSFGGSGRAPNLLSFVWQNWNEKKALEVKDPSIGDEFQAEEVLRSIHVGLLCVQEDKALRPHMATVVLMLSDLTVTLPKPSTPAFIIQGCATSESETH